MSELPPQLETLLVQQVVDRKRSYRKTAIVVPVLFLSLAAASFFALSPPERNLWVLCAGAGLLGLLFFIPALGDPRKARPLQLLRERPQEIVWIYAFVVRNKATSWILLRMADGKHLRLPVQFGGEDAVLQALGAYLPHATSGFSDERDAQYRRDPASLRRPVGP
ncbi:MAG: hypothetical protein H6742_12760 [Alphaproteobacteria bacterium]|nr:hypothetical protein [Alphaproteobacteria bacterium]